jgi:hypothetical protein
MKKFLAGKVVSGSRLFVGLLQLILVASIAAAQSPQAFTPTGNLNTGRNGQRAIPLNDGTILVTGGYDIRGQTPQEARILHDLVGFAGRILLLTGCGGGTPIQTSSAAHATPAGTYHLLLVGQSASAPHVVTLTLNVR